MELAARGVERHIASESVAAIDEPALALQLARKRLRTGAPASYEEYQDRTGPFLLRRGFGLDVARVAMRNAWDELGSTEIL
jgi:SOS response regulatory protein OraA/RecX